MYKGCIRDQQARNTGATREHLQGAALHRAFASSRAQPGMEEWKLFALRELVMVGSANV
jgi:hypothetical protein